MKILIDPCTKFASYLEYHTKSILYYLYDIERLDGVQKSLKTICNRTLR